MKYMHPNTSKHALIIAFSTLFSIQASYALDSLNDEQMSAAVGQGDFLTMKNIGTNELGNPNDNVAFKRVTMNAKLELNSNIKALRLGCDNSNYTDCDISIDDLALTGLVPKSKNSYPLGTQTLKTKIDYTKGQTDVISNFPDAGPTTDFVMDKPFIELAIQNPDSLTDRRVVGYRFGAHSVWGLMSIGSAPVEPGTRTPIYPGQPIDSSEAFKNQILSQNTGINSISGRLPQRLDNGHVQTSKLSARAVIVAGNLERDINSGINSFGRERRDYLTVLGAIVAGYSPKKGYVRNVWLGDNDTIYDPSIYGPYAGNNATYEAYRQSTCALNTACMVSDDKPLAGRALEFKRANTVNLTNMVTRIHNAAALGNLVELGDLYANQLINLKLIHQLQLGHDYNNNLKYDEGEGVDHFAFQFQSLDGLQWITTDKRFADRYDQYGRVVPGTEKAINGGYDWLSTRAGWWLEQPVSTIRDFWIPGGQVDVPNHPTDKGLVPNQDHTVGLGNLDLGKRPVDNCYGELTFC